MIGWLLVNAPEKVIHDAKYVEALDSIDSEEMDDLDVHMPVLSADN